MSSTELLYYRWALIREPSVLWCREALAVVLLAGLGDIFTGCLTASKGCTQTVSPTGVLALSAFCFLLRPLATMLHIRPNHKALSTDNML